MKSILDIEVSCFKNYNSSDNPETIKLLDWLQSDQYKREVEQIRLLIEKGERDTLKAKLPAITASGVFSYRAKKGLIKHSGFIAIDIDLKGNEHIENFKELKKQLCNIINVAYCGLSVSGHGYWCLIPIAYSDKHELHFRALQETFKSLGIIIDACCKDISRLRGYSYDPEGYFNYNPQPFLAYKEPAKKPLIKKNFNTGNYSQDIINIAIKMINSALDGEKHHILLKAATLMGGYIATGEVDESKAISEMEFAIQNRNIDDVEAAKKTIRSGIEYGKSNPISSKL